MIIGTNHVTDLGYLWDIVYNKVKHMKTPHSIDTITNLINGSRCVVKRPRSSIKRILYGLEKEGWINKSKLKRSNRVGFYGKKEQNGE